MAETLPAIPYKTPLTTQAGFLSEPWAKWFRQMFLRIGGTIALSNIELENQRNLDVSEIQEALELLEQAVSALSETSAEHTESIEAINVQIEDLLLGRQL